MEQQLALLILGDLDPYPPNLTRRALPPPDVRRAGKRGSRILLEQACRQLVDEDPHRQITYTAVKNRITALRAGLDARPTTDGDIVGGIVASPTVGAPGRRDTSRAHLAGISAFTLDNLISPSQGIEGDNA